MAGNEVINDNFFPLTILADSHGIHTVFILLGRNEKTFNSMRIFGQHTKWAQEIAVTKDTLFYVIGCDIVRKNVKFSFVVVQVFD